MAATALGVVLTQGACMQGSEAEPLNEAPVELAKASLINAADVPAPLPPPVICGSVQSLESYAIYAKTSISLGARTEVHGGNVGVHLAGATPPVLDVGKSAIIDGAAVAPSMRLANLSNVGPIYLNGNPQGTGMHGVQNPFPGNTPELPVVASFTAVSSPVITVNPGPAVSKPPGDYGDVNIKGGATLILAVMGNQPFRFHKLSMGAGARLFATGPVTVEVEQTIDLNGGALINAGAVAPAQEQGVKDFVVKTNASPAVNGTTLVDVVTMGRGSQFRGLLLAPNGKVTVKTAVVFTGAMAVGTLRVGGVGDSAEDKVPTQFVYENGNGVDTCRELCDDTLTTDVQNLQITSDGISFFDGTFPESDYLVKYEDGCMRYNKSYAWSLHALAPQFAWYLVGTDKTHIDGLLPGTQGYLINHDPVGFDDFEDCVSANQALPAIAIHHHAGPMGVYLSDEPYGDNVPGARNPTWSVTQLAARGQCGN